jgi:hypothetical protein
MNQLSHLNYEYSSYLFKSILLEQSLAKNFLVLLFFISWPEDINLLSNFALKSQGKLHLFKKSSLVDLTKYLFLEVINPSHIFFIRGIVTHKCVLVQLPIKMTNIQYLTDFLRIYKNIVPTFTVYKGLYLNSFISKLILLKRLPHVSNIVVVFFFCLRVVMRKLLGRFLLLNLSRKLI